MLTVMTRFGISESVIYNIKNKFPFDNRKGFDLEKNKYH